MTFINRLDAGRQLAEALRGFRNDNMIILALPRGGVPIGYEIAQALGVPLDVLVVRKLGTPGHEELAMGAVGPGVLVLNEDVIRMLRIPKASIDRIASRELREVQNRLFRFRGEEPFPNLQGKTVVIVDDGLATGATARAALQAVRLMQPRQLILAVPVCAADSADALRPLADDLICLEQPQDFMAVGNWYEDFRQVSDQEVMQLLDQSRPVGHLDT